MKKEKNKFMYVWVLCLILMISLFFVGRKAWLKGTYSADEKCYTFNGNEICINKPNTLYGEYKFDVAKFKEAWSAYSDDSMDIVVNFKANGKEYKRISYEDTGMSFGILYYCYTTYGACSDDKIVEYKSGWGYSGWDYVNGWNESNSIIKVSSPQTITANQYSWFERFADPVNKCYYNKNENEFVWTNVTVGTDKSDVYSTEYLCNNARVVILNDSTGNVTISGYGTPHYHWTSKGSNFNPTEIYATTYDANDKRTGYDLMWNTKSDGSGELYNHYAGWTVDGNLELYATWIKKKYFIWYEGNGGTFSLDYEKKTHGEEFTLTTDKPTRKGYDFIGWNTKKDGSGQTYQPGQTYNDNASLTLYAQWFDISSKEIIITYNANGGTNAPDSQSKKYNEDINLRTGKPSYDGCTDFVSWNTKVDGSGKSYQPGQTYSDNVDLTLYAQWSKKKFVIVYDSLGGIPNPAQQTVTCGKEETLSSITPMKTCYTFKGWYNSGNWYIPGKKYTFYNGLALYAQWEQVTCSIKYNANGGTNAPSSQTKKCGEYLTLTTDTPKRDGYTFIGWGKSKKSTSVVYRPGDEYKEASCNTLYAIWAKGDNLERCNIRDNPPTSDKMLWSIGLLVLTFVGFGYCCFIIKGVKD